jgi:hypothetical protein
MKIVSSESQIATMRARLGPKAERWSDKGLDFLSIRSRGKGQDGELAEKLIDMYDRAEIDKLPKEINHEAARAFNRGMLDIESILILLLGRKSKQAPEGKGIEELSASLSSDEEASQKIIADALTGGVRYINKKRKRKS